MKQLLFTLLFGGLLRFSTSLSMEEVIPISDFISGYLQNSEGVRESILSLPLEIQNIIAQKALYGTGLFAWLTNKFTNTIKVGSPVSCASFDPTGRHIVTGSDETAKVWNAQTGELMFDLAGHDGAVVSASFDPTGRRIVTASWDGTAKVWNAQTGEHMFDLAGHAGGVSSTSFDPTGRCIVTASYDGTSKVWNAQTGEHMFTLAGHTGPVYSASFDPTGRHIVTASKDGTSKVWNAQTGEHMFDLAGHAGLMYSASFDPTGRCIVTASQDKKAKVWNAQTGKLMFDLAGHDRGVLSASFDSTGRRIVTASDDRTAKVWDLGSLIYLRDNLDFDQVIVLYIVYTIALINMKKKSQDPKAAQVFFNIARNSHLREAFLRFPLRIQERLKGYLEGVQ